MTDDREMIVKRFQEAGAVADRFIDVEDGSKRSVDHTQYNAPPAGNYGIYATAQDQLVIFDIDDYGDIEDADGLTALTDLPDTLEQESPHGGTHQFYKVKIDGSGRLPSAVLEDSFATTNPQPTWGEVRTANQYVVGAGSELNGCDKEWCEDCATPDGGRYTVESDRGIATIDPDTLVSVLEADPALSQDTPDVDTPDADSTDERGELEDDLADRLEYARDRDDLLDALMNGDYSNYHDPDAKNGIDRSKAEYALATKLAFWLEGDKHAVRRALDRADTKKWAERTDDSYRNWVLSAVDNQSEYYDPNFAGKATDGGGTKPQAGGENTASPANTEFSAEDLIVELSGDTDASITDFPQHQLANGIERLIRDRDDIHLRLLDTKDDKDEVLYAMDTDTKVWKRNGERRLAKIARQFLGTHNRTGVQNELKNAILSSPYNGWLMDRDDMGAATDELPLKDCILDLTTREPRTATPEDYILGRLPVEYDPTFDYEHTQFYAFIQQAVNPEDRKKLQEYAGYTLLGTQKWKKSMFLVGPTDSGKSSFLNTLKMVLGTDNISSETLDKLLEGRWALHSLYGNMANISNETTPGKVENVERYKTLTGGEERVTAEDKGTPKYQFTVTQKFWFATNEFPDVKGAGEPFFNRLLFALFPRTVPEEEQVNLLSRFRWEKPAILNWMLDGLDRLRRNGGVFTNERTQDEKQELTAVYGSPIEQFALDAITVTDNPEHVVHKDELYAAFTRHCDFIRADDTPSKRKLTRKLKESTGITDGKSTRVSADGNQVPVYKGLKLNEDYFTKIQVNELPSHSYEDNSGGDTRSTDSGQTTFDND